MSQHTIRYKELEFDVKLGDLKGAPATWEMDKMAREGERIIRDEKQHGPLVDNEAEQPDDSDWWKHGDNGTDYMQ